jgi:hypothetical protein
VLNDDQFYSIEGKTKHSSWLELCDLTTRHAKEVLGLNVDAIIRGGIRKFMLRFSHLNKQCLRRGGGGRREHREKQKRIEGRIMQLNEIGFHPLHTS